MGTYWRRERIRGRSDSAVGSPSDPHRGEPGGDPMRDPSLAPVIRALTSAPSDRELDGLGPALVELRAQVAHQPTRPRRHTVFATVFGAKLGATLGGVAAGLVGVGTVVMVSTTVPSGSHVPAASAVPAPAQPRPAAVSTTGTPQPEGPDASGPAKHGLCTAWQAHSKHPGSAGSAYASVALTNLVEAAGGPSKVAAFCADVLAPGAHGNNGGNNGSGNGHGKPTGKATDHPGGKPTKQPGSKPTEHPTGKPSDA